jgi:serine/threonine protein kinase
LEEVGVGHFGSVWKARDTQLDRTVALKIPRKGRLDALECEQFFREARAAAQSPTPHRGVHEVGRTGTIYIVSDLVDGQSLADWLADQRMTSREAATLCEKLAIALHHAHSAGVIHRDLKPANVLLDGQGEPHVTDFGLARRDRGETTVTLDGQLVGTPAYMSPEQARGEAHTADHRSDIYALGVILFELLTGELPFRGNAWSRQVLEDEPPSPRRLNHTISRDLATICLKTLEKDPARRYATAGALADDLARFLRREPIVARPIGRLSAYAEWRRPDRVGSRQHRRHGMP